MTTNENDIGKIRFANLELHGDDAPVRSVSAQVVLQAPAAIQPGQVDPKRADVARSEREAFNEATGSNLSGEAGVGPDGGTFYNEGTVVCNPDVPLQSRREWERQPKIKDAAEAHTELIKAENRKDFKDIQLSSIKLDQRGVLITDKGGFTPNDWSWMQIRNKHPVGTQVPNNFNSWLNRSHADMLFRTRQPEKVEIPELYAALTDRYAICDGHEMLQNIAAIMPDTMRADVKYDPATTQLVAELTLHNPYSFEDEIAVGRMHRIGLRLRTADNGRERWRVRCFIERLRCINCTTLPFDWGYLDVKHMGRANDLAEQIMVLSQKVGTVADQFGALWAESAQVAAFKDVEGVDGARKAFQYLVKNDFIDIRGVDGATLVERLIDAWSYEPGSSHQSINRAVSRAAKNGAWNADQVDEIEETAGSLLFQKVWEQVPVA